MKNNYQCPFCKGFLNVGEHITITARLKNGLSGMLLLHPELGNYEIVHHPRFVIESGETVEFKCPICSKSLTSDKNEELAQIIMTDDLGKEFEVYFSKIKGIKSTYQIIGDNVKIYGDDSTKYIDFFNLSQLT
ncbi:MAG: hypothetical protein JEZ03_13090 [Bacteroidales bacterium]|nr:hypothetical protein [Bacteroidales bacterium]